MSRIKNYLSKLATMVKDNALEAWSSLSIFVGLPIVAWLYFDYKAALLVFFVLSSVLGTMALRKDSQ